MRTLRTAMICALFALAGACTPWQKPGALEITSYPLQPGLEELTLNHLEKERQPVPLSIETPLPTIVYDVRPSLKRPPNVLGNLDAKLRRKWQYVVIHHSATDSGSEAAFDRNHKGRGWQGVGYDFVIGNGHGCPDGLVEVTFRWERQLDGAHAGVKEHNKHGVGICLVGDFERRYPTTKQMEALVGLVNYLQERCRIPTENILLHRHIRPGGTCCPGKNFPFYDFISLLAH